MLIPLLCLNRPTKKWIPLLVENNLMYLRLHFFDCVVFTANQQLQEDHNLPMHRRHLQHMLCNLDFDYEPERRHMGSRLACPGRGFLPDLSPVSLQRVSIHLDLKRNKKKILELGFSLLFAVSKRHQLRCQHKFQ